MAVIDSAPARTMDPLQSVLMHLPGGAYGAYQMLCDYLAGDPTIPESIKEGLRFLSAARIGCAFCTAVRLSDGAGARLLPDAFYDGVLAGRRDWANLVPSPWASMFQFADEVLEANEARPATAAWARAEHADAEIVEGLFFMLLIGASHRLSRALGIEAACLVPTRLVPTPLVPVGPTPAAESSSREGA